MWRVYFAKVRSAGLALFKNEQRFYVVGEDPTMMPGVDVAGRFS